MALILAIEPDRRQASQLTAIVRGRLHAELVLGESAERALAALGQRVPDLILTSVLLSPKDEATLGVRLRALDGAAVHVQTLTIPMLAISSEDGGGRLGGVLSALRREKSKSGASDGCDPDVFAEQCREYLERAAAERAIQAERAALTAQDEAARAEAKRAQPKESERPHATMATAEKDLRAAPATDGSGKIAQPIIEPSAEPFDEWEVESAESFAPAHGRAFTPAYDEPIPPPEVQSMAPPEVPATAQPEVASLVLPQTSAVEPPAETSPKKAARRSEKDRHGLRDILGLRPDSAEGPASLLAAVAALEAEQQVHAEPVAARSSLVDPDAKPFATPPDPPPTTNVRHTPTKGEEELDLSSLLNDFHVGATPHRRRGSFDDDPVVEVYEIDNALLAGSLDVPMAAPAIPAPPLTAPPMTAPPLTAPPLTAPPLTAPLVTAPPMADPPMAAPPMAAPARQEKAPEPVPERKWPELDHLDSLIKEVKAAEASAPKLAPPAPLSPGQPPATNVKPNEKKQLSDILEALRRDAEQVLARPAPIASTVEPAAPRPAEQPAEQAAEKAVEQGAEQAAEQVAEPQADPSGARNKRKRSKDSPAQDEWGFFDPDQCGFAALIEKLEEITDEDDTPAPKRGRG
jgi:hypothetical protein